MVEQDVDSENAEPYETSGCLSRISATQIIFLSGWIDERLFVRMTAGEFTFFRFSVSVHSSR
jgi:hypothetical protein